MSTHERYPHDEIHRRLIRRHPTSTTDTRMTRTLHHSQTVTLEQLAYVTALRTRLRLPRHLLDRGARFRN